MSTRWRAAIGLAALAIAMGASARAVTWTRAVTAHFEVFTTDGARTATAVASELEGIQRFFDTFMALPPFTGLRTQVVVFGNRDEYRPYRTSAGSAAYYQPATDRDFIVIGHYDADSTAILTHEYAHAALQRSGASYPTWLSEGLAEFLSTVEWQRDVGVIGAPPPSRLAALTNASLIPIRRLVEVTHASPEYTTEHTGVFYAESWALTHMLVAGERYQPRVDGFLRATATGSPTAEALTTVFGTTLEQLDSELRQYISRGFFRRLRVPYPRAESAPAPTATPVASLDAELVLAQVLAAGSGRDTATRAAFDALLRDHPDEPRVEAARGRFELQSGNRDAARDWLERAVAHRTTDAMAWSELAQLTGHDNRPRTETLHQTAVQLAPDHIGIRLRYAAFLVGSGQLDNARRTLAGVRPLRRADQFLYHQITTNLFAATNDFDEAAREGRAVVAAADTASERAFAQTFLRGVSGPADLTRTATGRLRDIDCSGPLMVLSIDTNPGRLRLQLDQPRRLAVGGGGTVDLTCGPQDRAVRVGYAHEQPPDGLDGRLRLIDFRERR